MWWTPSTFGTNPSLSEVNALCRKLGPEEQGSVKSPLGKIACSQDLSFTLAMSNKPISAINRHDEPNGKLQFHHNRVWPRGTFTF